MSTYYVKSIPIVDGRITLPEGAIPLKVTLMLTKPFKDPDCKLVDGVSCLIPVEEVKDEQPNT